MNGDIDRQRRGKPKRGQHVRNVSDKPNARAAENYEKSKHAFELSEEYMNRKRNHKTLHELKKARGAHMAAIAALNSEIKRIEEE
jgi:hypothetical protein